MNLLSFLAKCGIAAFFVFVILNLNKKHAWLCFGPTKKKVKEEIIFDFLQKI